MPKFLYTARAVDGEIKSGSQEAKDREDLAHILRAQGIVMTSANEEGSVTTIGALGKILRGAKPFRGVSLVDKIMFTRNLAVMIGAGLALN
ncbi:MAG: hypothetical protein AAB630_01205, partial [Patescibacteria group bacterium]